MRETDKAWIDSRRKVWMAMEPIVPAAKPHSSHVYTDWVRR